MRTISVRVTDLIKTVLPIGFAGENLHTRVNIDCKIVFDEYPTATVSMTVKPPKGDAYPAIVVRDGDIVTWDVSNSDLIYEGNGELQLAFVVDEVIAKSFIGRTRIQRSIIPTGEIPDPIEDWITKADEILDSIPGQIDTALEEAKESGEFDGADGFSPEVSVSEITGGHQVSITDSDGTSTFDVMDGEKGDPGNPGSPGQDGFSPTASVSKSGNKSTITITDKTGTTTAEVLDGSTGPAGPGVASGGTTGQVLKKKSNADYDTEWGDDAGGVQIDDSAGIGDTGVTWSANKSATELSSKYEKPSGGIPSSDMDSAVQTSLGKADTAYQKPSGGIPSTDIASGVIPDVTGKADKVSSPTSGNFAALDSNGNLTDSGHKHSDYVTDVSGKLDAPSTAGTSGQVLTSDGNGGQSWQTPTAGTVTDVQVNGTSVVSSGVANIPMADGTTPGVVIVRDFEDGLKISSNRLQIAGPSDSQIKAGNTNFRAITPYVQHTSVFYALAKAAGADMASLSSTTVGTYPDAQKIAIQKMLGIYEPPYVLLNDVTVNERTCFDFTTDSNGNPYNLLSVYMEVYYDANLISEDSGYGRYFFYNIDGFWLQSETGRYTTNALSQYKIIKIEKRNNLKELDYTRPTNTGNQAGWLIKSGVAMEYAGSNRGGYAFDFGNITRIAMHTNDYEPAGTRIKIWGQWAY